MEGGEVVNYNYYFNEKTNGYEMEVAVPSMSLINIDMIENHIYHGGNVPEGFKLYVSEPTSLGRIFGFEREVYLVKTVSRVLSEYKPYVKITLTKERDIEIEGKSYGIFKAKGNAKLTEYEFSFKYINGELIPEFKGPSIEISGEAGFNAVTAGYSNKVDLLTGEIEEKNYINVLDVGKIENNGKEVDIKLEGETKVDGYNGTIKVEGGLNRKAEDDVTKVKPN